MSPILDFQFAISNQKFQDRALLGNNGDFGGSPMNRMVLCTGAFLAALALPVHCDEADSFFNGKDLTGWQFLEPYWSVKDGAIVGSTPDKLDFNTFLCSKREYKDFELKFKVRLKG